MANVFLRAVSGTVNGSFRSAAVFLVLLLMSMCALAGSVSLAWDPVASPPVAGYIVYYGPTAGNYTVNKDVGNVTTYTVPNLVEGATYHFAVTAYDAASESGYSNDVGTIVPYSKPVAEFSASTTSGTAPLALNFLNASTGTITTSAWTFGDGTSSGAQNPSHVYAAAGTYSVSLTVNGPGGSSTLTKSNYVTVTAPPVTPPPVAAFGANVTSGVAPLTVNFTTYSTGSITTYAWSFGDGTTSSAPNPAHTYSSPGVYTVMLTVNGPGGSNTLTKSNYVTVTAPPNPGRPGVDFGVDIQYGVAPLMVAFTSTPTGVVTSYAWSFGDGATSSAANPVHLYLLPGAYTVKLTVSGPGGSKTLTRKKYIVVSQPPSTPPPVAAFAADKTSGSAPLTVNFTSSSTGSITSYSWSFGDGTTSNAPNPAHVYSSPGAYTVGLTVTGPGGSNTKTSTGYITVTAPPTSGCPCSLWSSGAAPATPADPDTNPVELGVKFRSDRNGSITGIRFYKSSTNTGTHVASLWTMSGQLLGRATFTNETASGWQQVNFATPVAITANTVYVASYHTNVGRYANDNNYFAAAGVDNGPLHALRNGASGSNGVYAYGATPTFPNSSYLATNYWVDVIFN